MGLFSDREFVVYSLPRIVAVVLLSVALVWGAAKGISFLSPAGEKHGGATVSETHESNDGIAAHQGPAEERESGEEKAAAGNDGLHVSEHGVAEDKSGSLKAHEASAYVEHAGHASGRGHKGGAAEGESAYAVKGLAFLNAAVKPIEHELDRFWGWRPNDIIEFTDNVNNFQLGVLEVTRRTAVMLAERLTRTGTTDVIDPNLERAMNRFMIKADSFWLPSAESEYRSGIKDIRIYAQKLAKGQARFFTRADNLIPLLRSYANLLGGCDENLVKDIEETGEPVSTFSADNYFYYAKGVASAMLPILEAVGEDFAETLESRVSTDTLHHAIEACRHASELSPIVVFESDKDGFFANHRANLAAYISHARFYLDVLVGALST